MPRSPLHPKREREVKGGWGKETESVGRLSSQFPVYVTSAKRILLSHYHVPCGFIINDAHIPTLTTTTTMMMMILLDDERTPLVGH